MSLVELEFDAGQFGRAVEVVAAAIGLPLKSIFEDAMLVQLGITRARFLQQTSPDGSKWPESAAAIRRRKQGRGGGTLYNTGRMFHSMQVTVDRASNSEVEVSLGTDVLYAAKHQGPLARTPPNMERIFLGWAEKDEDIVLAMITANTYRYWDKLASGA